MKPKHDYIIYTDGGSRGNPGPSAYGLVIYDSSNKILFEEGKTLGINTNNFAEYSGVIAGLKWVEQNSKIEKPTIQFFLDSQLAVMQLTDEWKIKNEVIRNFYYTAKRIEERLDGSISYTHVRREKNTEADRLVNMALDAQI